MMATLLAANLADRAGPRGPRAVPYSVLGCTAGFIGLERLAQRYFARARDDARRRADRPSLAAAEVMTCALCLAQGRWQELTPICAQATAIASEVDDQITREALLMMSSAMELLTGRLADAARNLDDIRQGAARRGARLSHAWGATLLSMHELWVGRTEAALQLTEAARRDFAEDRGTAMANALAVSATATWLAGDHDTALARASEAVAVLGRGLVQVQMWIACDLLPWTLLQLWDEARVRAPGQVPAIRKQALMACSLVKKFVQSAPIGAPLLLRAQGTAARLSGRSAAARKQLERAVAQAQSLQMPIAELTALLELAKTAPRGSAEACASLQKAGLLASQVGCMMWSQRVAQAVQAAANPDPAGT
jgi:hypothetical protein